MLYNQNYAKHEFDCLTPSSRSKIELRICTSEHIDRICELTNSGLPGDVASAETVYKVINHNKDSVLGFWSDDRMVGMWAMLMLNPLGLERFLLNEFDTLNPPEKCLTTTGIKPAAIYIWAVVAKGMAVEGLKHVSKFLSCEKYKDVNFFSIPVSADGIRMNLRLGFQPTKVGRLGVDRYIRLENRNF